MLPSESKAFHLLVTPTRELRDLYFMSALGSAEHEGFKPHHALEIGNAHVVNGEPLPFDGVAELALIGPHDAQGVRHRAGDVVVGFRLHLGADVCEALDPTARPVDTARRSDG